MLRACRGLPHLVRAEGEREWVEARSAHLLIKRTSLSFFLSVPHAYSGLSEQMPARTVLFTSFST